MKLSEQHDTRFCLTVIIVIETYFNLLGGLNKDAQSCPKNIKSGTFLTVANRLLRVPLT